MPANDPFATVRKQAQRALDVVLREIRNRERELKNLVAQAEQWQAAINDTTPTERSTSPRANRPKRRAATKRPSGGNRVSWDGVLNGLPAKFNVDDVLKRPGVKQRGRNQVYPAITRWMDNKKVKRVGKGKYQKL